MCSSDLLADVAVEAGAPHRALPGEVVVLHDGVEVAGGVYMPGPDELLAIRTWLAANHEAFRKAARTPEKLMGKLQGTSLQRVPKGFSADHPAAELLKRKQWYFYTTLDVGLAETPKLVPELIKRFRAMLPVVGLLNTPLKPARARGKFDETVFAVPD